MKFMDAPPLGLFVAGVVLALVGLAAAFYAPCGCYAGSKRSDTPARCFNDFQRAE